jgi:hypothetical protein
VEFFCRDCWLKFYDERVTETFSLDMIVYCPYCGEETHYSDKKCKELQCVCGAKISRGHPAVAHFTRLKPNTVLSNPPTFRLLNDSTPEPDISAEMWVCEFRFNQPDPRNPKSSGRERNFYVWVPLKTELRIRNHRLTLRKNLVTGEFEVYRAFGKPFYTITPQGNLRNQNVGSDEIIYKGDFAGALEAGNHEYYKAHGRKLDQKPCIHRRPYADLYCPRVRGVND